MDVWNTSRRACTRYSIAPRAFVAQRLTHFTTNRRCCFWLFGDDKNKKYLTRTRADPLPSPPLQSANAVTYDEFQGLTYLQVKGTGLANTCPVVETGEAGSKIPAKDYKLEKFCMEPTSFTVKEESSFKAGESEFTKTKLMTRLTYTLDGMTGSFKVGSDGSVAVQERDGLDYAAVTVQLPGGGVPLLLIKPSHLRSLLEISYL